MPPSPSLEEDQHVVLRAMSWQDFEALLAIRGDRPGVRMYYLDGEIELFPKLDLTWLRSFLEISPQSKAVRALRDALRTKTRRN